MKVKVFTLPWRAEGGFDDSAVETFLEAHTAVDVSEHFFVHEKTPVLVLVVTYRSSGPSKVGRDRPATGRDLVNTLTPAEKTRYEALRAWRNQRARQSGKPPYLILTNQQAAELARTPPASAAQLREVRGIGESRVEAFGEELIALLRTVVQTTNEPTPSPVSGDG